MPKKKVSITDQEIAFARVVLSGTMTDRDAAQSVGLNPNSAAYIKAKPCVRAYMLEHRAAVQKQLADQRAAQRPKEMLGANLGREEILARLWEAANMSPEKTRGSVTSQLKALSLIVAMEGLMPDRHAGSSPQIYAAAGLGKQQEKTIHPEPSPALAQEEDEPDIAIEPSLREFLRQCGIDPNN